MAERNYYIILEVPKTATTEEIKTAYRILAKKYHPDKNIGNKAAEEYFKEIQQAYAILSNPEKRRKYDQRFFQTARTQSQQKAYTNTPYTGNAYQYAQQQAQAKHRANPPPRKQQEIQPDRTESWQILVSVGIALVLLYFIISYSNNTPASTAPATPAEIKSPDPVIAEPAIENYESPYSDYFGEDVADSNSKNSINIFNSDLSEAIVCLIEKNDPHRIIRNQYVSGGVRFKMSEIPDGEYFLRIYFGNNWDPSKLFLNISAKGGFKYERGFAELNSGKNALKMQQVRAGNSSSYSSYEIHISPDDLENAKVISAKEFFQK